MLNLAKNVINFSCNAKRLYAPNDPRYIVFEGLSALNNLVEQYLVFAEGQALQRIPMNMQDWITKLDGFLNLNDREILDHKGKISHQIAKEKVETVYEKFNKKRIEKIDQQDNDFEKIIKKIHHKTNKKSK